MELSNLTLLLELDFFFSGWLRSTKRSAVKNGSCKNKVSLSF